MKREVFAAIQNMAVTYEKQHGRRKGLTPLITNQLLAEALIHREILPVDFIEENYGSPDPIAEGFPYRGWRDEATRQKRVFMKKKTSTIEIQERESYWKQVNEQYDYPNRTEEWKRKMKARAMKDLEKHGDKIPSAAAILMR